MSIQDVLREMADAQWGLSPQVRAWRETIEWAMREPSALIVKNQAGQIRLTTVDGYAFDLYDNLGAKLFALPPDAAGELSRITEQLHDMEQAYLGEVKLRLELEAEIERLQRKLMLVTNFPSHPGGHPDDQSEDAMVPADWRHGWICAVAAMQEALAGKEATK